MSVIRMKEDELAPEMKARIRQTPGELQKSLKRAAMRGRAMLVRRTPKDLGQAKAGWTVSEFIKGTKGARVDLFNDNPYIGVLEEGARPHRVNMEGRVAIYEWVRRNIPPTPASGPIQRKTGGRRAFQESSTERHAQDITAAIVWKLRMKGQEPTYFVKKSMPELNKDFGVQLDKQIAAYAKRRANRKRRRGSKS